MRIEVQVEAPAPRRPVRSRGEVPAEKLAGVAAKLADSPLKAELERIAGDHIKRTRSKT